MRSACWCVLSVGSLLVALTSRPAFAQQKPSLNPAPAVPLKGPSWLRTMTLPVDMTPLGHLGGEGQAPATQIPAEFIKAVRQAAAQAGGNDDAARKKLERTFQVGGATLYRLNCRSCHGPLGAGKPPAVASIISHARALAPSQHEAAMQAAGSEPRPQLARQLADHAEKLLRKRLSEGGNKPQLPYLEQMPPFAYLSETEIVALEDYLKELAGAPAKEVVSLRATESALRIGEFVVRGTCRICHDATGPGGGQTLMMAGLIPALVGMPGQMSLEGVVHKVRHGWKAMAGMAHQMSRMPVLSYISDEEVVAAYLYLTYVPPTKDKD
jgi:mono/diheme cytochrome c family protein